MWVRVSWHTPVLLSLGSGVRLRERSRGAGERGGRDSGYRAAPVAGATRGASSATSCSSTETVRGLAPRSISQTTPVSAMTYVLALVRWIVLRGADATVCLRGATVWRTTLDARRTNTSVTHSVSPC